MAWPDTRLLDLVGIDLPIVLAPMIGPKPPLAERVAAAGGLGSLACASMSPDQLRATVSGFRRETKAPLNLNFFCHTPTEPDPVGEARWRVRLARYYEELDLDPDAAPPAGGRSPFDAAMCAAVEEIRPEVVSFHFGLPKPDLLDRVKRMGCRVFSSATTVAEARWLEERGVDAVIAQGSEAGGHRGMFLTDAIASQIGLFALLPQVVDAVRVPVIAAGGIADGRGLVAALALGASAVQIGTAYLRCPEAGMSAPHREALRTARDDATVITNVLTGRPARGIVNRAIRELGPLATDAPAFPRASNALQPLRQAAEAEGSGDFSPLWSGQAGPLAREIGASELTRLIADEALNLLARFTRA